MNSNMQIPQTFTELTSLAVPSLLLLMLHSDQMSALVTLTKIGIATLNPCPEYLSKPSLRNSNEIMGISEYRYSSFVHQQPFSGPMNTVGVTNSIVSICSSTLTHAYTSLYSANGQQRATRT